MYQSLSAKKRSQAMEMRQSYRSLISEGPPAEDKKMLLDQLETVYHEMWDKIVDLSRQYEDCVYDVPEYGYQPRMDTLNYAIQTLDAASDAVYTTYQSLVEVEQVCKGL